MSGKADDMPESALELPGMDLTQEYRDRAEELGGSDESDVSGPGLVTPMDEGVSSILHHKARTLLHHVAATVRRGDVSRVSAVMLEDPAGVHGPILHLHCVVADDNGVGLEYLVSAVPTNLPPIP